VRVRGEEPFQQVTQGERILLAHMAPRGDAREAAGGTPEGKVI